MESSILPLDAFWESHPEYWITPPDKHHTVDTLLYNLYFTYDYNRPEESLVSKVIYLDQLSRHFARYGAITEEIVTERRKEAVALVQTHLPTMTNYTEFQILFCLMALKHAQQYDTIFEFLHTVWLQGRLISEFPRLEKFYMDTYKKAYTLETVTASILHIPYSTQHTKGHYHPDTICDSYPEVYQNPELWSNNLNRSKHISLPSLKTIKEPVFVSLSGGVDSMVMTALLKLNGTPVKSIHILYGNRTESEEEYHFLHEYCHRLDVPLYVYRIPYIRRTNINRAFYEAMTRDLRFLTYRACANLTNSPPHVLLGHIQEDVVENIWTNISKGQHLDNLAKMETAEIQHGVTIMRPLLETTKDQIYAISTALGIPYLKNTTPSWSNRGKFREHFHKATINQYGPTIDRQMIAFSKSVQNTYSLVNDLLYKPIYTSFQKNQIDIQTALTVNLDVSHWIQIFTHICHNFLQIHRPSIKAIQHFQERIYNPLFQKQKNLRVNMGADLYITVQGYILTFHSVISKDI
jgi:tRNA(Ile)-lysidine synthetase-like protein